MERIKKAFLGKPVWARFWDEELTVDLHLSFTWKHPPHTEFSWSGNFISQQNAQNNCVVCQSDL